jgi:hypothetical protein
MKTTTFKKVVLTLLSFCFSAATYAKQLEGNVSLNQGHYQEYHPSQGPGYFCEYHNWEVCVIWANVQGVDINIFDDLLPIGKLKIVFTESWGAGQVGFSYDTPLPSSIASQIGMPTAKIATGTYPVIVTAAYPLGYVEVNVIP